ncbi:hypothetical protein [Filifactor alocis]|uniref:hypothetical protein n=1 Tax=Filifactor alocis TaxID=143361 RepID=UPI003F9FBADD
MKIQPFEKRALSWSDVEGADELKESFRKFNDCYKICNESRLSYDNDDYFTFCNDLLRHRFNKPFCSTWRKCPEELTEFAERIKIQMDNFILKGNAMTLNEVILPKWNQDVSDEKNNDMLETLNIASYNKSFSKKFTIKIKENENTHFIHLTVEYGDTKTKQLPHFATSASSSDGNYGQCQYRVLPEDSILREFWEKWDYYHLQTLTNEEYEELIHDLEIVEKELESEKEKENENEN